MANLVRISATSWVNLDLVTDIQFLPDFPRSKWDVVTNRRETEKKDRLVFSFAVAETEYSSESFVEAVDDWARNLRSSLIDGLLSRTHVASQGES